MCLTCKEPALFQTLVVPLDQSLGKVYHIDLFQLAGVLGGHGLVWEGMGLFGRTLVGLGVCWRVWDGMGGFGVVWEGIGGFVCLSHEQL